MTSNILSIDVGMKNLAICLFSIPDNSMSDNIEYKIELWDVLNLCEEQNFICGEKNKKLLPCNKNATFFKNDKFYCKIHAKNKIYKIPSQELNPLKFKKLKVKNIKELANKYHIEFDTKIKKDDLLLKITKYVDEHYLDYISKKKTKDMNLVQYGRNLKKKFNEIFKDIQIDGVIVENQIGPLAMRMKTLQGMIMQHFIEKNVPLVEEVSASNKLKEFIGKEKTTYSERKKLSIDFTREIISNDTLLSSWLEIFNKHKKKDDLADSFLQGRWYLKKTKGKKIIK
uniref:Mitochondrial resolvase Ydc2 catalytic domain-containing protein n=1 Tax=viral metagenome TaxID=1070528 RepID=A0A6C0J9R1_9ZZZZ